MPAQSLINEWMTSICKCWCQERGKTIEESWWEKNMRKKITTKTLQEGLTGLQLKGEWKNRRGHSLREGRTQNEGCVWWWWCWALRLLHPVSGLPSQGSPNTIISFRVFISKGTTQLQLYNNCSQEIMKQHNNNCVSEATKSCQQLDWNDGKEDFFLWMKKASNWMTVDVIE